MIIGAWLYAVLSTAVGVVYPSYSSFKALRTEEKEDDMQWLTYWVIYAVFGAAEIMTDYLLYWVPFYYELKLGFLCWLVAPKYQALRG